MTPERLSPTSTLLTRERALAGRSKSAAVQQNNAARAELSPRSNSLSPALIAHSRGRTLSAAQRRPYIPTGNMLTEVRTSAVPVSGMNLKRLSPVARVPNSDNLRSRCHPSFSR